MSGMDMTTVSGQGLSGKRIVITRARAQAKSLARKIEAQGGVVVEFPTIAIAPPADPAPLDDAIQHLERYDWLILTSTNAAERLLERIAHFRVSTASLGALRFAAIGPETATRLAAAGFQNCLIPAKFQAEGILDNLALEAVRGRRILIPRAAEAREILPETLRQWGADVDVVEAYRTVLPNSDSRGLEELIRQRCIAMVTFTSSSTAVNFARVFGGRSLTEILDATPIACIGPITSATVAELGGAAAVVASEFTMAGLVRAMVQYFSRGPSGGK